MAERTRDFDVVETDSTRSEASTRETPNPGTDTIGGYRILRLLGVGGMGQVYAALDPALGREVAIKVLRPETAARPAARERFLREARAVAAVRHDHVVPIYHVGDDGGTPYLVMPLLPGEPLDARLARERTLRPAEVARIGAEAAAGLAAAHAAGLVHRDVKPANLWLEAVPGGWRVKVLDFGLARGGETADHLTDPGAVVGTPRYMSPEQADGKPPDPRSDLFALGAVLYEVATGTRAFPGEGLTAILKAVAIHHPRPPAEVNSAVPPALSDLIVRMLDKDPAGRPADAQTVSAQLAAIGSGARVVSYSTISLPRQRRRSFWMWTAIAAGIVVAAIGVRELTQYLSPIEGLDATSNTGPAPRPMPPPRYRGRVDVLIEREVAGAPRLLRLNTPGALPLRTTDKFRIEGQVDPPAYVYVVWVDPGHDVTLVYPWDATKSGSPRPANEQPTDKVGVPADPVRRYEAREAKPGVATMVLLARPTPLDVPDEVFKGWFETLPDLPLPAGGEQAAVWFDDYVEVRDPDRPRTFAEVGSNDPFTRWQGQLQAAVGRAAAFQTAVSFARTGAK